MPRHKQAHWSSLLQILAPRSTSDLRDKRGLVLVRYVSVDGLAKQPAVQEDGLIDAKTAEAFLDLIRQLAGMLDFALDTKSPIVVR